MNAIGWQIGAVLFGLGAFIVAIYFARTLNSFKNTLDNANHLLKDNSESITNIIKNTDSITTNANHLVDGISEIATVINAIGKIIKRDKK